MTSKTISVSEDAYKLLMRMKLKDESFTETIRRLAKRRRLADCAGLWIDIPDDEMKNLHTSLTELRETATESLEKTRIENS